MKKRLAVDSFCGAGGLSLGLSHSGFDVIFSFDNDEKCIETIVNNKKYLNHRAECHDVRDLLNGKLLKKLGLKKGELDLLAGGPPCQGFSIQRTVGGNEDARNLLVDDYGDLILEVLPKFFILENVPGLGGARGKDVVSRFRSRMNSHGYLCHEKILDAQDYGVPQRRRRYIIVGEHSPKGQLTTFEWPAKYEGPKPTVKSTISHLPKLKSDGVAHESLPLHRADKLSAINIKRLESLQSGQARTDLPEELLAECHKNSADIIGHRNVYGRMSWDEVAPTITARFDSFTRGKFGHPVQKRSISLLEGALLQTFPEDYFFSGKKVDIARQIGNAVPPSFGHAIGRAVLSALNKKGC
jgi:DNA (cytosine-5)-methyltransferase 1